MKQQIEAVPGDVLVSAALVQREMLALANSVYLVDNRIYNGLTEEYVVRSLRFVAPKVARGDWLAVVSITTAEGKFVGFHQGTSFKDVLQGVTNRLNNGSMNWKEDQYG